MRFKVDDIVWTIGLTIRRMGTQHPNAYYLLVKAKIGWIEEHHWGRVFHIQKLHKPKKFFRRFPNTTVARDNFGASKTEVSKSLKKIQRLCKIWNKK